jgi:hypothetical protein
MARKLLYCPLERVVLGDVDSVAGGRVEGWTLHIFRDGHEDIDVVGDAPLLVVALHLDDESNPVGRGGLHDDVYREKGLDPDVQSVTHQLKLSIRGDESHQSLILEAT